MSGSETRRCILDAAEQLFAERGYDGTSLRSVMARAGVNVAAVHYHFGNKLAVFEAVVGRRLDVLDSERRQLLAEVERASGGRPSLQAIVEALVAPSIDFAGRSEEWAHWTGLVARYHSEPGEHWQAITRRHRTTVRRFVKATARALPQLERREVEYRLFLAFGAIATALLETSRMKLFQHTLPLVETDPEGVKQRLVAFVTAGLQAGGLGGIAAGQIQEGVNADAR